MLVLGALKKRIWETFKLEWTLPSGIKAKQKSYSDWYIFNEIFVNGLYDPAIEIAIARAPSERHFSFVDLGANVGFFSLRVSDAIRQRGSRPFHGVLVEGHPRTAADLKRRIHVDNSLFNLQIVNGLVGSSSGTGYISNLEFSGNNTIYGDGRIEVPFVDLDCISPRDIDLLKCDIEGAELQFVENNPGVLARTSIAVFELHYALCDVDRCRALIMSNGFTQSSLLHKEAHIEVSMFCR